jgi:hypothetical protein
MIIPTKRFEQRDGKEMEITRVYPKVSGLAAWSENCIW